jgi:hypothetical protein
MVNESPMPNEMLAGFLPVPQSSPPLRPEDMVPVWVPETVNLGNCLTTGSPDSGKSNHGRSAAKQFHILGRPVCSISGKNTNIDRPFAEALDPPPIQFFHIDPKKSGACLPLMENLYRICADDSSRMADCLTQIFVGVGADQAHGSMYYQDSYRSLFFLTLKRCPPILHLQKLLDELRNTLADKENRWLCQDAQHVLLALAPVAYSAPHLNRIPGWEVFDHERHLQTRSAYAVINLDIANFRTTSLVAGKAHMVCEFGYQSNFSAKGIAIQSVLRVDDGVQLFSSNSFNEQLATVREKRLTVSIETQDPELQAKGTKGGARNFGEEIRKLTKAQAEFTPGDRVIESLQFRGGEQEVIEISKSQSSHRHGLFHFGWTRGTSERTKREWRIPLNDILEIARRPFHFVAQIENELPILLRLAFPMTHKQHEEFRATPWPDAAVPAVSVEVVKTPEKKPEKDLDQWIDEFYAESLGKKGKRKNEESET